jgi:hypothetical protein
MIVTIAQTCDRTLRNDYTFEVSNFNFRLKFERLHLYN